MHTLLTTNLMVLCVLILQLWCYFILRTLHTLDEELLAITFENLAVAVVSSTLLHTYYRLSTLHTPLVEGGCVIVELCSEFSVLRTRLCWYLFLSMFVVIAELGVGYMIDIIIQECWSELYLSIFAVIAKPGVGYIIDSKFSVLRMRLCWYLFLSPGRASQ
jgi:hypothetical protein